MIIYNVTLNVDESIHIEWLEWMKNKHIPDVMATGQFVEHRIFKLVTPSPEVGVTYAIQYTLKSLDDLEKYQREFSDKLQKETIERYGGKFHAFRTVLETVD
jgi:hypothetical protein